MGVDGVDMLITFFFAVMFWFSMAHLNGLDETRKMGQ